MLLIINLDVFFSLTAILLKALEDISLYLIKILNQSILLIDKDIESLLLVFYYYENLC